jgi:starvation-inducible DNA-binding protein
MILPPRQYPDQPYCDRRAQTPERKQTSLSVQECATPISQAIVHEADSDRPENRISRRNAIGATAAALLAAAAPPCSSRSSVPDVLEVYMSILTRSLMSGSPASPVGLPREAVRDLGGALRELLADVFALYLKSKNFHWHMSGPHFRDYHLLLDEQSDQVFAMTDAIAERARKIGAPSIRSIGEVARLKRIADNDADHVDPQDMLAELREDNLRLEILLRQIHGTCDEYGDVATASLVENWIDETERRIWFLHEAAQRAPAADR